MASSDESFARVFPRTTSPIVTLLQKKRALNNEIVTNKVDPNPKYNLNLSLDTNPKYNLNLSLDANHSTNQTNREKLINTNKSLTPPKSSVPKHRTNQNSPTKTTRSPAKNTTKPATHFHTPCYNRTRYTPRTIGMENIREHIVKSSKKADSRDSNVADASYHHEKFSNKPSSIEFYQPGSSSLAKKDGNPSHLISVEKPGDLCRYIVSPPSQSYNVIKNDKDRDEIPPLRPPTPHGVYMNVHKGGEVPLEGLYCHPFFKPDLNLSTRKNYWDKDMLNIEEKPTNSKSHNKTSSPVPRISLNNLKYKIETDMENETLCDILAATNLNCKDRRSRDEINKARKLQMDLYIKSAKLKRRIEEEKENENRRHSDNSHGRFCKSPVTLDRYDLEDDAFTPPTSSPIPSRQYSPHPTYKAKVLYNFYAKNTKELTLQKGDVVLVWSVLDENWMKGEHHGSLGIFPSSYVQIFHTFDLTNSFSSGQLFYLLYNFKARTSEEINLKKGDVVRVLERINKDWLKVEMLKPNHIRDRFPENIFFHKSPNKSPSKTLFDSLTRNNLFQNTNNSNHDLHSTQIGLVPPSYLIPLERNIDTIHLFPNSPHFDPRTKTGIRMNVFKLKNSTSKEISKLVVKNAQKEFFFTNGHSYEHLNLNGKSLNKPNFSLNERKSNGDKDEDIWDEKEFLDLTSKSSKQISPERKILNKFDCTLKQDNTNESLSNDFYIDESYMDDLNTLNASIDPFFFLNLSKLKPPVDNHSSV